MATTAEKITKVKTDIDEITNQITDLDIEIAAKNTQVTAAQAAHDTLPDGDPNKPAAKTILDDAKKALAKEDAKKRKLEEKLVKQRAFLKHLEKKATEKDDDKDDGDKSKSTLSSSDIRKIIDAISKTQIDPYKDKLEKLTKNLELEGKTKSIGSLATKGIESVDPVKIKDTLEKAKSGHYMSVSKLQDIHGDVKKAAANETLKKKIKDEYAKIIAKLG